MIPAVDYFSKWHEVELLTIVTTENITKTLLRSSSREGYPEVIISDPGPEYESMQFQLFLDEEGILHRQSAIYHPQAKMDNKLFKDLLLVSHAIKGISKQNFEEVPSI